MKKWWVGLSVLSIIVSYVCYCLARPLDVSITTNYGISPTTDKLSSDSLPIKRGAIGYIDPNSNEINCRAVGTDEKWGIKPTASLAKMITIQVVLDKKPIKVGESGPAITMSSDDEARYWQSIANNGSSVYVRSGSQISERQLLEGIILASANNMADSLAIWAFGSLDNYRQAATSWLQQHGLLSTTIGDDASGYNHRTTSSAMDLCKIQLLATTNPVINDIAKEKTATMPSGEIIRNTNKLLGSDGIFSGKTGFTDDAGHGVMLASHQKIGHQTIIMAAISLSNDSYAEAFDTAHKLVQSEKKDLRAFQIKANQTLGNIQTKWGSQSNLKPSRSFLAYHWIDQPIIVNYQSIHIDNNHLAKNGIVGNLSIGHTSINMISDTSVSPANVWWRLSHPL